jgi:FKBP-type peptidyl-prolyl cis-trans isomerase FklB
MKKVLFVVLAFTGTLAAQAQTKAVAKPAGKVAEKPAVSYKTAAAVGFKNTKDSASYALGYRIAQSLAGQGLQGVNVAIFEKGLLAGFAAKPSIPDSLLDGCIKSYQDKMSTEKITENRAAGAAFLAENAKRQGVVRLSSGLQYEVIVAGAGTQKPTLNNKVKCHYHGTLINGTVFDSSVQRGEPISFPLNICIPKKSLVAFQNPCFPQYQEK